MKQQKREGRKKEKGEKRKEREKYTDFLTGNYYAEEIHMHYTYAMHKQKITCAARNMISYVTLFTELHLKRLKCECYFDARL